jgi:hypothetical protein
VMTGKTTAATAGTIGATAGMTGRTIGATGAMTGRTAVVGRGCSGERVLDDQAGRAYQ